MEPNENLVAEIVEMPDTWRGMPKKDFGVFKSTLGTLFRSALVVESPT